MYWFRTMLLIQVVIPTLAISCTPSPMVNYKATHESAKDVLPWAVELEELYGGADHFITHFGFANKDTNTWNTEVFFGDRYRLAMQVKTTVDYGGNTIALAGEPRFFLFEITDIEDRDGQIASSVGEQLEFDKDDWKKAWTAKGDFSVIGFSINSNPVPNFDVLSESVSADRRAISLID